MSSSPVAEKVNSLVEAVCKDAGIQIDVSPATRLGDLCVDSLKLVDVVYELETTFAVQADEERLTELQTVGDIVSMFETALQKQAHSTPVAT